MTIRILCLEDNPTDAMLLREHLHAEDLDCEFVHVNNRVDFEKALHEGQWDCVLSDYALPGYTGISAVGYLREHFPSLPAILVSGTISESEAVESLRAGAIDYIIKARLERLKPAILRAIQETREKAERLEVERQWHASEGKFRAFMDNSQVIGLVKDSQGKILDANQPAADLFGQKIEDLLNKTVFDLLPRHIALRLDQHEKQVLKNLHPLQELDSIPDSWGNSRHYVFSIFPLRNTQGNPLLGIVGIDITERVVAEEELRRSEERFQLIARATDDILWDWDLQTNKVWWNDLLTTSFGFTPLQLADGADFWRSRLHPDDTHRVVESLEKFMASELATTWTAEYRVKKADGAYAYVYDRAYLMRDYRRKPVRMVGAKMDITQRKLAEARILEQATLLDKARDAICLWNMDLQVLYWNQGAERLYGWSQSEILGRKSNDILFPTDTSFPEKIFPELLAKDEWVGELEQKTRDGKKLIVESRWTLMRDESRQPKSVLMINTDVTEKRHYEAEMLRNQRVETIGALAGTIAHDLNNFLAPIVMASDFLDTQVETTQQKDMIAIIRKSASQCAQMVRQILNFSRGTGRGRELIPVSDLIQQVEMLARQMLPRSIKLEIAAPAGPVIQADATQMQQLFMNLIVNARDAMEKGGVISIDAEKIGMNGERTDLNGNPIKGSCMRISVRDTGSGIPPEIAKTIFQPFFTTKAQGKGTGLGLSTVVGILKNHNGAIELESAVGRGTCFNIFLPECSSPAPSGPARP